MVSGGETGDTSSAVASRSALAPCNPASMSGLIWVCIITPATLWLLCDAQSFGKRLSRTSSASRGFFAIPLRTTPYSSSWAIASACARA